MDDKEFHEEQLKLFAKFNERLQAYAAAPGGEAFTELAGDFAGLAKRPEALFDEGPPLVGRMLTTAPQLAQEFPRELLWYLGGECLHYMPDEEIDRYTALDEQRREAVADGRPFDWQKAQSLQRGLQ